MRKSLSLVIRLASVLLGTTAVGGTFDSAEAAQSFLVVDCQAPTEQMSRKGEAECACQAALQKNTIEALESFLLRYGDVDSECTALATTALSGFTDNIGDHQSSSPELPVDSGGYAG